MKKLDEKKKKCAAKMGRYEGSKVDKYLDKKLGAKEGSKKDEEVDKHMAKVMGKA